MLRLVATFLVCHKWEITMPETETKAGAPEGFDIMKEVAVIDLAMQQGAAFLNPGISDIAVVLYATGLIEKILRVSLIASFRKNVVSKRMVANVFDGKGPLATFSAKIELCAGFGHIVGDVHH